ncbi:TetR/AcrR family transcriptional regulator [Curtobacterium sp. ISL-83]|uniref:TetR/AcrR family transcriptional regulator n=1 Tax=Curtobacterium sp. ISL-83 TaxID=2819145 RepID=UPI001BE546BF|nr:TetR family transcriptional regulator C-terminal domain-containing protein [Curtobacterium sp. ISL-83]MBT2502280.1 TetR family transcriptional regulator C-terminal domain-containing protein [Curtobacterium sp. ISL-83]
MSSDADLRARIVTGAIEAYRAHDYHSVGVEQVAEQAELTVAEVQRLYPLWDLLVVAVMDRWNNGNRRALWHIAENEGVAAYLRARLEAGLQDPALVRLRLALLSAASSPDHAAAGWFRSQYTTSFQDLTLALVRDVVAGREPRGASPRHAAEQLLALYEGLQLQGMVRDGVDLLSGYDRAVGRMRSGWTAAANEI